MDAQVASATALQQEEENPCLHNTYCWPAKPLKEDMADPWACGLLKHPWQEWDTTEEFPRYTNAGISGMGRCQQIHLWWTPKVKSHLGHPRKNMPLWQQLTPWPVTSLHIQMARNVCWNKVILCLSVRLNIQQASLERKGDTVPSWLHR